MFLNIVYGMPSIMLFMSVCTVVILLALANFFIFGRFHETRLKAEDTEAMAVVSATVGVFYAVLYGFLALYVLNNFDKAQEAVFEEANVLAKIYQNSKLLPEEYHESVTEEVKSYIKTVLHVEWPLLEKGKNIGEVSTKNIDSIVQELKKTTTHGETELFTKTEVIKNFISLYEARQKRIFMATPALSPDFWVVIILGIILVIIANDRFRFQMKLHILSTVIVSLAVSSIVFLILVIDHPYRGEFSVTPEPLQALLENIEKDHPSTR